MQPEETLEVFERSRRAFLRSCGVLALGVAGCAGFAPASRFARIFLPTPHPDDYMPVLHGIIGAVLPLEEERFPRVSFDEIGRHLLELFPLQDERYSVLARSILYFDAVDLFPHIPGPIADDERVLLYYGGIDETTAIEALVSRSAAHDAEIFSAFRTAHPGLDRFLECPLPTQRGYLALWKQSGFIAKRQFYDAVKSLVMITAYTREDVWAAIGYAGPVLPKS